MPLVMTTCKTCSTGGVPADADFCPNCGRRLLWTETARGRRRATVVAAVVVALLLATGAALWWTSMAGSRAVVAARPTPAIPPPPPVVARRSAPALAAVAATPPPPPVVSPVLTAPVRPGDTDLTVDPLAAYAGGPAADRLTLHGLRLGLGVDDVPPSLLSDGAPDHLRDVGGDLFAVDADHITEVHVRDADVLAHWPIDSTNALVGHFGEPAAVDADGDLSTFVYPARGIHVRWDAATGRIDEVVLVRPTPPVSGPPVPGPTGEEGRTPRRPGAGAGPTASFPSPQDGPRPVAQLPRSARS